MSSPDVDRWMDDASCRDHPDPNLFFDGTEAEQLKLIRTYCVGCPVAAECLDAGLSLRGDRNQGVWGGTTALTRKRMNRRLEEAARKSND